MIPRLTMVATTLALAGLLAACESSVTQPSLDAASSVAFAKGGNSDAAKACQNGGFATLQGADGQIFRNAGECVAFAAKGGLLQPIGPRITELDIVGLNCTELPWTVSFLVTFSGGTGTVNGYPMTSGVEVTIPQSADGLYEFVVTNGTQSVTDVRRFNCT